MLLGSVNFNVDIKTFRHFGFVKNVKGLLIETSTLHNNIKIGSLALIYSENNTIKKAEVIGFNSNTAYLMLFDSQNGIYINQKVEYLNFELTVTPHESWQGRVIDCFANPIDDKGPLIKGRETISIHRKAPDAMKRNLVAGKIDLGVRSLNAFLTCCKGQRMGIFAGSGVGKSILMSMITKYTNLDIIVIGLVGERGREVQEFLQQSLGEEGLKKAIVVVATSADSALSKKQAAYLAVTIAEFFASLGKDVLCMIDSVTRFAMAQREIGLAIGEPPTTKGYPPSVFVEMPALLERTGPTIGKGSITGIFTVLVEGDDDNEPVSDTTRGILDGHIVLDRNLANQGLLPAVNILKSVSRTMPGCNNNHENAIVTTARRHLANYYNMEELIKIGAYKKGSNPEIDEAIFYYKQLFDFLKQKPNEKSTLSESYQQLENILQMKE